MAGLDLADLPPGTRTSLHTRAEAVSARFESLLPGFHFTRSVFL